MRGKLSELFPTIQYFLILMRSNGSHWIATTPVHPVDNRQLGPKAQEADSLSLGQEIQHPKSASDPAPVGKMFICSFARSV